MKIGHTTGNFYEQNAPQARFLDENIAPQAIPMKQITLQARFF